MGQIADLVKLFGLRKLLAIGLAEKAGRGYYRGYMATMCYTVLLNIGFVDRMLERRWVHVRKFAADHGFSEKVLECILHYLDGISLVRLDEGFCRLLSRGRKLAGMPRGGFSLLWGYEPVFHRLEDMVRGEVEYGRDVIRRGDYIAKGSGELSRHLPFPIMRTLLHAHGVKSVLDLGSGDLEFLFSLCEADPEIRCYGIDISPEAVQYAEGRLQGSRWAPRVHVDVGDMFDIRQLRTRHPHFDAITAIDTFHEYLVRGHEVVVDLLRDIRAAYPKALLVVGEFCKQSQESLRRRPTGFLEHHLFHSLTNQEILYADQWLELFDRAGYDVVQKKVFNLVGHGYFVLRAPDPEEASG